MYLQEGVVFTLFFFLLPVWFLPIMLHFLQEPISSCLASIILQPKLESEIKFADVYAVELLDEGPVCGPWSTRIVVQGKKSTEVIAFLLIILQSSFSVVCVQGFCHFLDKCIMSDSCFMIVFSLTKSHAPADAPVCRTCSDQTKKTPFSMGTL